MAQDRGAPIATGAKVVVGRASVRVKNTRKWERTIITEALSCQFFGLFSVADSMWVARERDSRRECDTRSAATAADDDASLHWRECRLYHDYSHKFALWLWWELLACVRGKYFAWALSVNAQCGLISDIFASCIASLPYHVRKARTLYLHLIKCSKSGKKNQRKEERGEYRSQKGIIGTRAQPYLGSWCGTDGIISTVVIIIVTHSRDNREREHRWLRHCQCTRFRWKKKRRNYVVMYPVTHCPMTI